MKNNRKFWVYIHTCPNGKKYVGVTTQYYPYVRWDCGRGYKNGQPFYQAVLEFGWNNIQHEVFEVSSEEEMYEKEKEFIARYNTTDPARGYNIAKGGKGSWGIVRAEEYKCRISETLKGRHQDEKTKEKRRESLKNVVHTKAWGQHISEAKKGRPQLKYKYLFPDGTVKELCPQVASRYYLHKGVEITLVEGQNA